MTNIYYSISRGDYCVLFKGGELIIVEAICPRPKDCFQGSIDEVVPLRHEYLWSRGWAQDSSSMVIGNSIVLALLIDGNFQKEMLYRFCYEDDLGFTMNDIRRHHEGMK